MRSTARGAGLRGSALSGLRCSASTGAWAHLAELTGHTAADTAQAVLATSASLASSSPDLRLYRFAFADAALLEPGKVYLAVAVNVAGTGTTGNRTTSTASGTGNA